MRLHYRRSTYHPGCWSVTATYQGVSTTVQDHSRMHAAYRAVRQVLQALVA